MAGITRSYRLGSTSRRYFCNSYHWSVGVLLTSTNHCSHRLSCEPILAFSYTASAASFWIVRLFFPELKRKARVSFILGVYQANNNSLYIIRSLNFGSALLKSLSNVQGN